MTDPFIISLTTYGERINTVHRVIDSLIKQHDKPYKIVLWLDEAELSRDALPQELKDRISDLVEVRFCPDYRSYKKLIPALTEYSGYSIITVDDDFEYPPELVSNLRAASKQYPDAVIASRGRIMNTSQGNLESYPSWELVDLDEPLVAQYSAVPIGYAGILYPPGILHKEVTNIEQFQKLSPHADDLWFKAMTMLNGKATVILPLMWSMKIKTIEGTQENALYMTHNAGDANTEQMRNILQAYPELQKIMQASNFHSASFSAIKIVRNAKQSHIGKVAGQRIMPIRNAALLIEKMDTQIALKLMEIAKAIRPAGPLINQKIQEYRKKLEQK